MKLSERIEELIQKMKDEVDLQSEAGELDRHYCQDVCEQYIKAAVDLVEKEDLI